MRSAPYQYCYCPGPLPPWLLHVCSSVLRMLLFAPCNMEEEASTSQLAPDPALRRLLAGRRGQARHEKASPPADLKSCIINRKLNLTSQQALGRVRGVRSMYGMPSTEAPCQLIFSCSCFVLCTRPKHVKCCPRKYSCYIANEKKCKKNPKKCVYSSKKGTISRAL